MNVVIPSASGDALTILDAFSGFGMLGEAVAIGLEAIGIQSQTVLHIERDSAAAAALVESAKGIATIAVSAKAPPSRCCFAEQWSDWRNQTLSHVRQMLAVVESEIQPMKGV